MSQAPSPSQKRHVIPYSCQTVGEEEVQAVVQVLQSAYLTQGPAIEQFETKVAQYCQMPYAVAFSSGTAALHACAFAAGLGPGDEAITSPLTFVATSNAILYQQATPVFSDINPHTLNLDIQAAVQKVTSRTKAILPIHFAGRSVDLEACYALADKHNLVVIEDACHALGGLREDGKPIGHCRDMAVMSFHPVKSITTGEGGMVLTSHRHYYEKLLTFRTHGITKNAEHFQVFGDAPWEYEMQHLGYNYRLTDIQAAIGCVQMDKLDGFVETRNQLAQRYRTAFSDFPALTLQAPPEKGRSAYHLFPVQVNPEVAPITRRALFDGLVAANIRPQVHYIPVHLQPYYREHLHTCPGDFPVAEHYYTHCLSLPLYPTLSNADQDTVIHQVKQLLS